MCERVVAWKVIRMTRIAPTLAASVGLRLQRRLTTSQAEELAECMAIHRDISLNF